MAFNAAITARILLLLAAFLINLGSVESRVQAQWATNDAWTTFVPATAVSFVIWTDQSSYSVREPITLKYRIVNVSNHALYVPRSSLEGCPTVTLYVWAWFEDITGRRSGSGVGDLALSVQAHAARP